MRIFSFKKYARVNCKYSCSACIFSAQCHLLLAIHRQNVIEKPHRKRGAEGGGGGGERERERESGGGRGTWVVGRGGGRLGG